MSKGKNKTVLNVKAGVKPKKNGSGKRSPRKNILLYNRRGETRIYLMLSFLVPFVMIWYFFAQNEIHPFGDSQILVTDLWHQYYPFFRVEHEKLQNLSSFLYSWDAGLGTNFISLMSYYAASPLNLLAVFFPLEYSRDALTLFLTIKIGCAGLFFAIFLKNVYNKNDISITAFAICYALCDFIMGYYWNIIWIDTLALLPLVVLGTIKLYKEGKYKLYIISLALSLVSSFYIGLFTCVFTVLVFAGLVIIDWNGFKYAFKRLGQIAGTTVIGIGLGAVILIPAFLGLMLTVSVNNQFPTSVTFYEPWLKMISAITGFHEPTAKEGLPNFYCGMFAVILLGVYIRSMKIKIREKIITIIYLAFIIVSCNMNVLNYMWHGFHFTNMLPYRFSFLLSFMLLAAGYRAFTVMTEEGKLWDTLAMVIVTVAVSLIAYEHQHEKAVILSGVFCLIFTALLLLYDLKLIKKPSLNRGIFNFAVFAVCFVEMGMNVHIGVKTVSVTDYVGYPRKNAEITSLIDNLESQDKSFYRLETTTNYTINDPALYGYRGISQFSSTANVGVTNLMHCLGIDASDIGNRYYYNQNTAVYNMFMNLKYLISTDNYSGDLTYLEPMAANGDVSIYKNNHYLPIGFAAESSITDFEGDSNNQFENQNELFRLATGIEKDVFKPVEIKDVGHKGLNVIKNGYGSYNYSYTTPADNSDDHYLKYNYTVPQDGPVYATFYFTDITSVKVKKDNAIIHTHNLGKYLKIFAAGDFKAGDVVTFQSDAADVLNNLSANGNGNIYVYQIDNDVFEEGYKKLSDEIFNVSDFDDTHIEGTINAKADGMMYTSIPYDGGWRVYIDGKKTEVKALKNALMCIPISAGEHKVKLSYIPPGFIAGLNISGFCAAVFILLWIFEPKIKMWFESRKKVSIPIDAQTNETEETAEDK